MHAGSGSGGILNAVISEEGRVKVRQGLAGTGDAGRRDRVEITF
jgi:hypothetical protein